MILQKFKQLEVYIINGLHVVNILGLMKRIEVNTIIQYQ